MVDGALEHRASPYARELLHELVLCGRRRADPSWSELVERSARLPVHARNATVRRQHDDHSRVAEVEAARRGSNPFFLGREARPSEVREKDGRVRDYRARENGAQLQLAHAEPDAAVSSGSARPDRSTSLSRRPTMSPSRK